MTKSPIIALGMLLVLVSLPLLIHYEKYLVRPGYVEDVPYTGGVYHPPEYIEIFPYQQMGAVIMLLGIVTAFIGTQLQEKHREP